MPGAFHAHVRQDRFTQRQRFAFAHAGADGGDHGIQRAPRFALCDAHRIERERGADDFAGVGLSHRALRKSKRQDLLILSEGQAWFLPLLCKSAIPAG